MHTCIRTYVCTYIRTCKHVTIRIQTQQGSAEKKSTRARACARARSVRVSQRSWRIESTSNVHLFMCDMTHMCDMTGIHDMTAPQICICLCVTYMTYMCDMTGICDMTAPQICICFCISNTNI